ncbi:hypothetical protein DM860_005350 [Cuscuta australis]|uniref:Uncharacterized protein n=1 Tax=Cuscuta australis TaxID=267555 RepID=A0A328DZ22_9ASTE|nr:hypothetical protein DM860_005350 [Cuscuta australis]
MENCGLLVRMCIDAATEDRDAVEAWRRQRRTLERLPCDLANILLHRLLRRRLLFPSLLEVFNHCADEVNLKGNSRVDAEWMAYLGGFNYLHTLNLSYCRKISSSSIWPITGMTSLKELDLSYCPKITDAGIRHLLSIPKLEKLWIARTSITAEGVILLSSLTNLSVLDLGGLPVTDIALGSLQALTKLQSLVLWGTSVSDKGASVLRNFRELSFLDLAWTKVTSLPFLPSLAFLNMSNCVVDSLFEGNKVRVERLILSGSRISDKSDVFQNVEASSLSLLDLSNSHIHSFGVLTCMNALTELDLSDCGIGDESVEYIVCTGPSLRYLNLSKAKVSSYGVGILAGRVPHLETLMLPYTAIDDNAISYISTMHLLKSISLRGTNVKGVINHVESDQDWNFSLSALHCLHHLERLDLEETPIRDEALSPLSNIRKLNYLSLRGGPLSDACLHHLSKIKNLINLWLGDTVLTNAGLDSFIPPSGLEVLDLNGCWLITEDAILSFSQNHPSIDLRHEHVRALPSEPKHKEDKQPSPLLRVKNESFIDQRLKYSREELLALNFASTSLSSPSNG